MKRLFYALIAVACLSVYQTQAQVSVGGLTPSSTATQVLTVLQPYLNALLTNIYGGGIILSSPTLQTSALGDKGVVVAFSSTSGTSGHIFMPYYNTNSALAGLAVSGVSTCAGTCTCTMTISNGAPTSCGCSSQTGGCSFGQEVQNNPAVAPQYWTALLQ